MTDDPSFSEDVKRIVRRHDPDPDTLRAVASGLEELADRYEATDDVL